MNIQNFSIIAGTAACNAGCPYCISKMTGIKELGYKLEPVNWAHFHKAARLAQLSQVSTVLMTGKGEPLLYPNEITAFLENLQSYNFPFIELQTNGLLLVEKKALFERYLQMWQKLGLSLVSISIVHYDSLKNQAIYTPDREYINLEKLVNKLHRTGFSVRFSCTLVKDLIDSPEQVLKIARKARQWHVEQLSLRPVTRPNISESQEVYDWTGKHLLSRKQIETIKNFLDQKGHRLITYGHGSILYDLEGQNVCLTNALTLKPETSDIRQVIYFPDGHLKFDWQYPGAILL
jgi:molybdenum cofactor biosynthesis enzyme MoaA